MRPSVRQTSGVVGLAAWLGALSSERRAALGDSAALAAELYADWYSGCATAALGEARSNDNAAATRLAGRPSLAPALRAALLSTGRFEAGWLALHCSADGRVVPARSDGSTVERILNAGEYLNLGRPGVPPAPGERLAVVNRMQWVDADSGYWVACSPQAEPPHPLLRVYWAALAHTAPALLRALLPVLDHLQCPWSIKCPEEPAAFLRRDALVLYLPQAVWRRAYRPLKLAARSCRGLLRPESLPLACPLDTGVAWAESDSADESFGQARCRLLAAALQPWVGAASAALPVDPVPMGAAVEAAFRGAGLDPRRPWLAARRPAEAAAASLVAPSPPQPLHAEKEAA
jgi:hypothetical protein